MAVGVEAGMVDVVIQGERRFFAWELLDSPEIEWSCHVYAVMATK